MKNDTNNGSKYAQLRELSEDEIEATAGAGIISWLRHLFGGGDPQPPRGPFNAPPDHLR